MRSPLVLCLIFAACSAQSTPSPNGGASPGADPVDASSAVEDMSVATDLSMPLPKTPILFVHGINGSAANFDAMIARFVADGWPRERLFARTFSDPSWGCNVDNAQTIATWVAEILSLTGSAEINIVAHSMGTLSSRYFVKNLGGTQSVRNYVTLGGMHHGLASSCSPDFPLKPCIWKELCSTGAYVAQLNAAPATPGPPHWVSIYSSDDASVPEASSMLMGAVNVSVPGATHVGLIEDEPGYLAVKNNLM